MSKKPKKVVKARRMKKRTVKKTRALGKPKPLPPGTYEASILDFETPPDDLVCHGAVTGRISSSPHIEIGWTIRKPLKPIEKWSKKELIEGIDRQRKHHDDCTAKHKMEVDDLREELEVQRQLVKRTACERDDAIKTRDKLLDIMHASYKEESKRKQ